MNYTYQQLTKSFQQREFAPVYLLHGEEPFYIDELSDYLTENLLSDTEKEFNQIIVYGRDTAAPTVINFCKQFPMIGSAQLVVLREGQDMDVKKEENLSHILAYIENPQKSTVFVICFKYKAPPAKLLKAITASKESVVYESKRKYENEIPAWVQAQVKLSGYSISGKAASMLVDFLGNNLEKINNELGKLYINHPKGHEITEDIIEKYIGVSKDYNFFEFQKALATKDVNKAFKIANHFARNQADYPLFKTLPMLFGFFNKVMLIHSLPDKSESNILAQAKLSNFNKHDYLNACRNFSARKVIDIISEIRKCNVRVLGIDNYSANQGELLKELVINILK
jgi:DNA polymerase-3 subunit delta